MKWSSAIIACTVAVAVARPAWADTDARSLYAGTWKGNGVFYATPYSKAGPSSDATTCRWEAARTYLVCSQTSESPYGPGVQLSIYTRSGNRYVFERIGRDGSEHASDVVVAGATWTYLFTFNDKDGKHVMMRTINDFSTLGTNKWRAEFSTDGGRTWTRTAEGVETKIAGDVP